MKTNVAGFICIAILTGFLALAMALSPKEPSEEERVAAANALYFEEIAQRSQSIPELAQFFELYPEFTALEFFNLETKEVLDMTAVANPSERFQISVSADVQLQEDNTYIATGELKFIVKDTDEKFTRVHQFGSSTGNGMIFGPPIWQKFYESGGDFESIRRVSTADDANLRGDAADRRHPNAQLVITASRESDSARSISSLGPRGILMVGDQSLGTEVQWLYLGSSSVGDHYEFLLKNHRETGTSFRQLEAHFGGQSVIVLENEDQSIKLQPAATQETASL